MREEALLFGPVVVVVVIFVALQPLASTSLLSSLKLVDVQTRARVT